MKNNFDFLRLVFALLVVIAHSYPLSGNSISNQWIYQITTGQIELSNIGLNGFFIISGYLIYQSLDRSKTIINYLWKRILRLFPALFVVLLLTVILALFLYEGPVSKVNNKDFYSYIPRNLSLYNLQYNITGVFGKNPFPSAINGSLWTICYEFTLYILLGFLFFVNNKKVKLYLLTLTFIAMIIGYNFFMKKYGTLYFFGLNTFNFFNLGTFFVAGSLLAIIQIEKWNNKKSLIFVVFILILLSLFFNIYDNVKHVLLTLLILLFGLIPINPLSKINKIGDLSYGVYIYSFPIQQYLMYLLHLNTESLMISSVLISIFFGYLSWHLIEKKSLSFKNKF